MYALNQQLPDDIKIVRSEEVAADFHPRYAACRKTYRYDILNSRVNFPKDRLYTDYVYYELNTDKMKKAAKYLLGEHDFTAFSSAGGQQKSMVRTIYGIDISEEKVVMPEGAEKIHPDDFPAKRVRITITGNGFLYNMVRIIAGTLEKVGMGIYPPEHVKEILESRDRRKSAPKASAGGLTLVEISYEKCE